MQRNTQKRGCKETSVTLWELQRGLRCFMARIDADRQHDVSSTTYSFSFGLLFYSTYGAKLMITGPTRFCQNTYYILLVSGSTDKKWKRMKKFVETKRETADGYVNEWREWNEDLMQTRYKVYIIWKKKKYVWWKRRGKKKTVWSS